MSRLCFIKRVYRRVSFANVRAMAEDSRGEKPSPVSGKWKRTQRASDRRVIKILLVGVYLVAAALSVSLHAEQDFYSTPVPKDIFGGPGHGDPAPDFFLQDLDGKTVHLAELFGEKPLLLILGSYTCPIYRKKGSDIDALYQEYQGKLNIFIVYTTEAHPHRSSSPYAEGEWQVEPNIRDEIYVRQPLTYEERVQAAKESRAWMKLSAPILIDDMDNSVWKKYGQAPNAAYLIGQDGRVLLRQGWFDPGNLRIYLRRILI